MSRRVSPSTDQVYGLQRVARIRGVSRAAVDRHRHQPRRSGADGTITTERVDLIRPRTPPPPPRI